MLNPEQILGARNRALRVEQMILLPHLIPEAIANREWDILLEAAQTIKDGIPRDLAQTDPARFHLWMKGLTHCYLMGYHRINLSALKLLAKKTRQTSPNSAVQNSSRRDAETRRRSRRIS